jgi:H+-transporting ATPase
MNQNRLTLTEVKERDWPELFQELATTADGLTVAEAALRLQRYGPNEIKEKSHNPIITFLAFFWGPIPWMIEVAAILAAVIHHWETFAIIIAMLLVNAGVGFWQRQKADHAIALLKQQIALLAVVRRNGQWVQTPAAELVPGDLVRVRLGDIVPADLKLFQGDYLLIDEAALTGESLPVEKHPGDVAYAGSVVRQGEMDALVVATGTSTYFGQTATLVEEARTQSHFQKALIKIGDYLIIVGLALVAVIFLVALFRHESLLLTLQYALVLTVAAVPATLPAVLSVTLAVGAGALALKGAITRRMTAIDELAGMDILCTDKTGTITQNLLSVREIRPAGDASPQDVLLYAALASRAEDQDPMDAAILTKAGEINGVPALLEKWRVEKFMPFDPVAKRTEAAVAMGEGLLLSVTKGAPQVIADLVQADDAQAAEVNRVIEEFADKGYRTLGVAKAQPPGSWEFVGLLALHDPPREDSAATIKAARDLGVDIKMVTGDHLAIAREVAREVGLGANIQPVSAFLGKPDREARRLVEGADGFAQVFPEHKYHIIELLQAQGHIVGMTGDGVNDAPALKKADAGIAVDGATDAAKSAAHIVLTRPGLSVVVDAIQESRKIFKRMKSYAIYRIGGIIRVLLFVTLSIAIFNFYPVTAIMIVLQTLLNDVPILSIAYDHVRPDPEPEKWDMREILSIATFLGSMGVIFSFSLFFIGLELLQLNRGELQTLMFLKLTVAGYLDIFMGRTRRFFWSIAPGQLLVWSGLLTRALATAIAVFGWFVTPISWQLALLTWGFALLELCITDPLKVLVYRVLDHRGILFQRAPATIA